MFTLERKNPCKSLKYKGLEICCSIQLSYGTVDIGFLQIGCKCNYYPAIGKEYLKNIFQNLLCCT